MRLNPGDIVTLSKRGRGVERLIGIVVGKKYAGTDESVLTIKNSDGIFVEGFEEFSRLATPEEVILYTARVMEERGKREQDKV